MHLSNGAGSQPARREKRIFASPRQHRQAFLLSKLLYMYCVQTRLVTVLRLVLLLGLDYCNKFFCVGVIVLYYNKLHGGMERVTHECKRELGW